jgi:hypothetical protein
MEQMFESLTSEKIIDKIKKGDSQFVFNGLCKRLKNEIYLDYNFFKYFASQQTYSIIMSVIKVKIDEILENDIYNTFIVHANLKSLSISDIDKHKTFIISFSTFLKERYTNKLDKCYLYNCPSIFSQIYNIINGFIDKDTQDKIKLM